MEPIQKLRLCLGVYDKDELLLLLLENAEELILDFIGRGSIPERLVGVQVQLSVIAYNRQGAEGNSSVREGNVSYNCIDGLPNELKERLKQYKRKVGVIRGFDLNA